MTVENLPQARVIAAADGSHFSILGQSVRVVLHSIQSQAGLFCFEQWTPPGFGVPPHMHSLEDEIAYLVEGTLQVNVGGKISIAQVGDTMNFSRGTMHGFTNTGNVVARTFWAVTPGKSFEAFFKAVSEFPPGPPNFEKLDALHKIHGIEMPRPN